MVELEYVPRESYFLILYAVLFLCQPLSIVFFKVYLVMGHLAYFQFFFTLK